MTRRLAVGPRAEETVVSCVDLCHVGGPTSDDDVTAVFAFGHRAESLARSVEHQPQLFRRRPTRSSRRSVPGCRRRRASRRHPSRRSVEPGSPASPIPSRGRWDRTTPSPRRRRSVVHRLGIDPVRVQPYDARSEPVRPLVLIWARWSGCLVLGSRQAGRPESSPVTRPSRRPWPCTLRPSLPC